MRMFDIDNTLLHQNGCWLELLSVAAGLTCVVLAGRNKPISGSAISTTSCCSSFFCEAFVFRDAAATITFGINFFGHWRWTHPRAGEESAKDSKALKVTQLTMKQRLWAILIVIVAGAAWGFVLSKLGTAWFVGTFEPDPQPWLDSFVLMLTLLAQVLSAQKKWDCWVVWLMVNLANITLYLSAGLVFMPIVSALYLINGIWSLWTWFHLYKNNN